MRPGRVRALPVPEPWLAEDRATLVGQRCGVRSTSCRVEPDGTAVYSMQLGRDEVEPAEVVPLRGPIAGAQRGLGGVGGGGVLGRDGLVASGRQRAAEGRDRR